MRNWKSGVIGTGRLPPTFFLSPMMKQLNLSLLGPHQPDTPPSLHRLLLSPFNPILSKRTWCRQTVTQPQDKTLHCATYHRNPTGKFPLPPATSSLLPSSNQSASLIGKLHIFTQYPSQQAHRLSVSYDPVSSPSLLCESFVSDLAYIGDISLCNTRGLLIWSAASPTTWPAAFRCARPLWFSLVTFSRISS